MAFDYLKGFIPDFAGTPQIEDVNRRTALAKALAGNQIQAQNPLGVLANFLSGAGSGYENSQAAQEGTLGRTNANAAIAKALTGNNVDVPGLMAASGSGFLPQQEGGLADDLIKRKMGIGETYYGTPIVTVDASGNQHLSVPGSLGDVKELDFGGRALAPKQTFLNTGNGFQAVPTNAGVTLPGAGIPQGGGMGAPAAPGVVQQGDLPPLTPGAVPLPPRAAVPPGALPPQIPINNAQKSFDSSYGEGMGKTFAGAPEALQKEGQLLQDLDNKNNLVGSSIDKAVNMISANPNWMSGTVGSIVGAVKGTPQYDLGQTLQTIKANVGFDTLQNMRSNSPTGGALGAISDTEEKLLQAVNGSLDPGQSAGQLAQNLQNVKTLLATVNAQKHQAYDSDQKRLGTAPAVPPTLGAQAPQQMAPSPGPSAPLDIDALLKKYQ